MEPFTPKVLFDLYCSLSPEQKIDFLKRVASICTAKEPLLMVAELPKAEQFKFSQRTFATVVEDLLPLVVHHARLLVQRFPKLSDTAFEKELHRRLLRWGERAVKEIAALERERFKEERDRKSDPETVRRNVEICDKRKQDKKRWTLGRLAKDYKMSRQSIVSILKKEEKWRRLAANL